MKAPESQKHVMKMLGALSFLHDLFADLECMSCFVLTPLHDNLPFLWNKEHEIVFNRLKHTSMQDCELTIPKTKIPFIFMFDASAIGVDTVIV